MRFAGAGAASTRFACRMGPPHTFSAFLKAMGVIHILQPLEAPDARCGCRVGSLASCAARAVGLALVRSSMMIRVSLRGGPKSAVIVARAAGATLVRCHSGPRLLGDAAGWAESSVQRMCARAPGPYQGGSRCASGASSVGACSKGPLSVKVNGTMERVAELLPREVSLGGRMGFGRAVPKTCFCGCRSLILAGGADTPGLNGHLRRSASSQVT